MKSIYSIAILLFCFIGAARAQSPNWAWAVSKSYVTGSCIATDKRGNSYVSGYLENYSVFIFGSDTLTNNVPGYSNFFIAKYSPSGNVLWARCASLTGYGYSESISLDSQGNAYVTGYYEGPDIAFGNEIFLGSSSYNYFFIVKYDSSGNEIWAKSSIGEGGVVSLDSRGNCYVTGNFDLDTITYTSAFLAKYDPSGNMLWAHRTGSNNAKIDGGAVSVDSKFNVYITGDTASIDTITYTGTRTFFISKYDSSGNLIWTKNPVESGIGFGTGIATDGNGNAYVSGSLEDSTLIIFDTDTIFNNTRTNIFFIVKYDVSGNEIWVKSPETIGIGIDSLSLSKDLCANIITDANGNSFIVGSYSSNLIVFGSDTLTNCGMFDFFIVKYDSSGNEIWAKNSGGLSLDQVDGISLDGNENIYVTGWFIDSVLCFGADTLINTVNNTTLFVAKLGDSTNTVGLKTVYPSSTITIYPNPSNGSFYFSGVQSGNTIEVYNVLGEVLYIGRANSDNFPVNLSGQAKGMYFYKVSNNAVPIQQGKMVLE